MRSRIARWLTLAAGATAMATAAGMATAQASVTPPQVPSKDFAGQQAFGNGWLFRYVAETVTLPDVTASTWKTAMPGGYGASVRLQDAGTIMDLAISTTPASGVYNAAFAGESPDGGTGVFCSNGNSPATQPGDTVRLEEFYNYGGGYNTSGPVGQLDYKVTDLTDPSRNFTGSCQAPGHSFNAARTGDGFSANDWQAPNPALGTVNGNQRLNTLDNVVETNRTGNHGTAGTAPWPVQRVAATAGSTVRASVPFMWGSANQNFSVWFPSAP